MTSKFQGPEPLITVVIVEDHRTMLWGLQRLVGQAHSGMRVLSTATNADEARARLADCGADVVLLDLDLDGHSAPPLIPELLAGGARRILVLTGSNDEAKLDAAVRAGARGVIGKAVPAEQVLKAIKKVHEGELWLDNRMLARLLAKPEKAAAPPRFALNRDNHASLTARELQVIQALVGDSAASTRAIAKSLFISEHTLRNHLVSVYHKLEVKSRLELYVYAIRHDLATDVSSSRAFSSPAR